MGDDETQDEEMVVVEQEQHDFHHDDGKVRVPTNNSNCLAVHHLKLTSVFHYALEHFSFAGSFRRW